MQRTGKLPATLKGLLQRRSRGSPNFGMLLDGWLQERKDMLKQSTYATYLQRAECHLRPALGSLKPEELSPERLREFCRSLEALAPATQRGILFVLNQVLQYGRSRGLGLPPEAAAPRLRPAKHRTRVLTEREQALLEHQLRTNACEKSMGLLICMYTGMRLGEICALKWGDIAPDNRSIHICRTVQRIKNEEGEQSRTKIIFDAPKSASSDRVVPVPPFLEQLLAGMRCGDDCFVLTSRAESFVDPRVYQDYFKLVLHRSGVADLNFHALRHSFATRCISLGLDAKSLSQVLGHSSVSTTLNVYVHPSLDGIRSCIEQMKPAG